MTTVIAFPPDFAPPQILTFDRASAGEAYAVGVIQDGHATFVFGRVSRKSLAVLTFNQLLLIYNAAHPDLEPIRSVPGPKRQLVERVLPLITTLARPGKVPITQETGTMATSKKKSTATKKKAPAATATAAKKKGRAPNFTGMKLFKTAKGEARRWQEGSRRQAAYATITKGMRYETALEKGVTTADITIMVKDGVLEAK